MTRRTILLSLACGLLAVTSGCCCGFCRGPLFGQPSNMCASGPCDTECGSACGATCGPACGPVRQRVYAARTCGPACSDCGDCSGGCGVGCESGGPCPSCGARGGCCCFTPLRWIARLFCCPTWCGPNGGTYCGEFCNDPPDYWDPCDDCGNWTGGGCSRCSRPVGFPSAAPMPAGDPQGVEDVDDDASVQATPSRQQPHKASRTNTGTQYQR